MRFLIQLGILVAMIPVLGLLLGLAWSVRDGEYGDLLIIVPLLVPASYVTWRLWKADDHQEQKDQVNREKLESEKYQAGALIVGNSWIAYAAFCFGAVLVSAATLLLFDPRGLLLGLLFCLVFWPPFIHYMLLWTRLLGRSRMVIDLQGIDHFIFGKIPWSKVYGISLDSRQNNGKMIYSLALGVDDLHVYRARIPWLGRSLPRVGLLLKQPDEYLRISLESIDLSPQTVYAAVLNFRKRVQPPLEAWYPGMTAAQRESDREAKEIMDRAKERQATLIRTLHHGSREHRAEDAKAVEVALLQQMKQDKIDMERLEELARQRIASSNERMAQLNRRTVWLGIVAIISIFAIGAIAIF